MWKINHKKFKKAIDNKPKTVYNDIIRWGQANLMKNGGKDMVEVMTDRQYDGILQMIEMIMDGCKDLDEAKRKISELRRGKKEKEKSE